MRIPVVPALLVLAACATRATPQDEPNRDDAPALARGRVIAARYRDAAAKILEAARKGRAYERLEHLCDRIGCRLSGSEALARAVAWTNSTMTADGLESRLEPVTVQAWIRGNESAAMTAPSAKNLSMLGLGNSVGTPAGGVEAEVVAVKDFDALAALKDGVRGKIVLFAARMHPYDPARGSGYGETVRYRVEGPSRAAAQGAVAALVRSVTAHSLKTPHTGTLHYDAKVPKIPAAALATEDADLLERLCASGQKVRVRLAMEAHFGKDVESANVIGELRGREKPQEVVLFGAHLNSWDVGQGAHDDGGPCVAVMESLRILKTLGLRPRRTIRAVLFVNEENGGAGAREYAKRHKEELASHVVAIESDSGAFRPLGFATAKAEDERGARIRARLMDVLALLEPIGANRLRDGGGGADVDGLGKDGVPTVGLDNEGSRYFDYHHTEADTFDKIVKDELDLCVAALATTVYVLADMDERLGD